MPEHAQQLSDEFDRLLANYEAVANQLAELVPRLVFNRLEGVLSGAQTLEVEGAMNEDWLRILRIRRVLGEAGAVLFDESAVLFDDSVGHDSRAVEELIDEVNTEYLDLLLDLTGDAYMGFHEITVGGS